MWLMCVFVGEEGSKSRLFFNWNEFEWSHYYPEILSTDELEDAIECAVKHGRDVKELHFLNLDDNHHMSCSELREMELIGPKKALVG